MEILIDIIIPIYNGEKYIDNMLAQLEKQTFKSFRAIFIDDGSSDNSYALLSSQLEGVDFKYLLLHQENGGASSARNSGMRAVEAPWIAFMDCDDVLQPEFLEYYYRAVSECGANLAMGALKIVEQGKENEIEKAEPLDYKCISAADAMRCYTDEWIGVCCLLISSDIQREYNLFEDEDCIYCEDAPYIAQVIAAATKVAKISNQNYIYPTIPGSLSQSGSRKKFLSGIASFNRMIEEFKGRDEEACKAFLECGCSRYYVAVLRKAAVQLSYSEFKKLTNDIPFEEYSSQIKLLKAKQRLAARIYMLSKKLFYTSMRLMFRS